MGSSDATLERNGLRMNQRVCKFVPKDNVPSAFVWFSLERPLHFIESTEVATTVIHLGKSDIDDFQFMRSSQEILDQFSKFTSPLLERMVIASKEIEILAELRDTLLPKLISGELRIPDAEKFERRYLMALVTEDQVGCEYRMV